MAGLSPIISIYITDIIICHKQRDTPIISHPSIHPSPQYQTSPFYGRNMCTYPIKPWFLKAWVFLQTINIHRPYNRSVLVFTKYIRNWDHRINKDHININIYISIISPQRWNIPYIHLWPGWPAPWIALTQLAPCDSSATPRRRWGSMRVASARCRTSHRRDWWRVHCWLMDVYG